jgi:hypothetical protein
VSAEEIEDLRQAEADLRRLLETAEGRRALRFVLRRLCGVFEDGYVPGGLEAERHATFNSGRRFVGLQLMQVAGIRLDYLRQFEEAPHGNRREASNEAKRLLRERQEGGVSGDETGAKGRGRRRRQKTNG